MARDDDFEIDEFAAVLERGRDVNAPQAMRRSGHAPITDSRLEIHAPLEEVDLIAAAARKLDESRNAMSLFGQFLLRRRIGQLTREQGEKVAEMMFRHEFEDLAHKMTLALDLSKKGAFIAYMTSTADIITILRRTRQAVEEVEQLAADGRLGRKEVARQIAILEQIGDEEMAAAVTDLHGLWANHQKLLHATLALVYQDFLKGSL